MTGALERGPRAAAAWARMGALAVVVLAIDQASKAVVRGAVERGESVDLALGFRLVNVRNPGIAFGLLQDGGGLLLVITGVTLAVLVAWFATGPTRPGLWVAVGLLVGGAIGNLVDRLREGKVTDFLDPPLWPAFNVADIAITAGVLAIVLVALTGERAPPDEGAGGAPEPGGSP